MMRGSKYIAALAFVLASCGTAQAQSWISRALFADGKLWLLEEGGGLSWITKGNSRTPVSLDQPVLDLIGDRRDPVIVTCDNKACENWLVRRWTAGQWTIGYKIPAAGDTLVAIASGDHIVLVTNRRMIDLKGKVEKVIPYQPLQDLRPSPLVGKVSSALVAGTDVWIGRDAGEWGGSLEHMNLATGQHDMIKTANPYITNVNALLPAPWDAHCILIAEGLVHMMASGEIVELCEGKSHTFYSNHFGDHQTMPFYGLSAAPDNSVWAAGGDGLYKISADGAAQRLPLPHFDTIDGARVSFATPRLALVLTDIHQHTSLSGSAPLLVPMDAPP